MAHHWDKDAHASGYDAAEAAHRLVTDAIGSLKAYDRSHGERDAVGDWLAALESQLAHHFHQEESVMALSRSPRLEEQASEHRRMLEILAFLHRQHVRGQDVKALLILNLVAFRESHSHGPEADEFGAGTARRVA